MARETLSFSFSTYSIEDLRQRVEESQLVATLHDQPVRFVPQDLIIASREFLDNGLGVSEVASYLTNAYEFYRGCVCWGKSWLGVPLIKRDIWEWLDSSDFSWLNVDQVNRVSQLAGKGLEDFGLGKTAKFLVDNFDNLGLVDYVFWQEESNALILKPLRQVQNLVFSNSQTAVEEIKSIIGQLELIYNSATVKIYDFNK